MPSAEFGDVSVSSIDGETWTFTVKSEGPVGKRKRVFRLHGMEEIEGALQLWSGRNDHVSKDMRHVLRFAYTWMKMKRMARER